MLLGTEARLQPRPYCVRWGRSYPREGAAAPTLFGPCLFWPRLPISGIAELLLIMGLPPHVEKGEVRHFKFGVQTGDGPLKLGAAIAKCRHS